jgi:hypothetical protein
MLKYPSTSQFRDVIRNVQMQTRYTGKDDAGNPIYDNNKRLPKIRYKGTVKVHGSNCSVAYDLTTSEITYQSRERVLTLTQDNAGFMLYMSSKEELMRNIFETMWLPEGTGQVVIFGEWAGQGIHKGVAVNRLPKMWLVFAIKAYKRPDEEWDYPEDSIWLDTDTYDEFILPKHNIYNINQFPTKELVIDFEHPEIAQNQMIEWTNEVDASCPVGKYFNVEGAGEGYVWSPEMEPEWNSSAYRFKVKGKSHSISKVKTLAPINIELMESQQAWVDSVCTENRLEQMLDNLQREKLLPFEMTSLGEFLRLVHQDVMKEHEDEIIANQFDPKKLNPLISKVSRNWYMSKLNQLVGV